jgi:hypothetical protein
MTPHYRMTYLPSTDILLLTPPRTRLSVGVSDSAPRGFEGEKMNNRWAIENTLSSECGNVTDLPWSVMYDVTPGQEPTFLSASIGGAQFDFAAAMQVFGVDRMTEFDAMALRAQAVKVARKPFPWEKTE